MNSDQKYYTHIYAHIILCNIKITFKKFKWNKKEWLQLQGTVSNGLVKLHCVIL